MKAKHSKNSYLSILLTLSLLGVIIFSVVGCKTVKEVPIEKRVEITYKDSTIWHTDTVTIDIPKEIYRDYSSLLDTLHLETSVASAVAYVDTANLLINGTIDNKQIPLKKKIEYLERIVYRDSVVEVEKPIYIETVKYRTPKWSWYCLLVSLLLVLWLARKPLISLLLRFIH